MAGIGKKLGAAFVDLFVRKDKFDADLRQVKQEVSETSEQIGKDAKEKIGGGFEESLKPAKKIRETLSFVVGTLAAITAALVGIAKLMVEWSKSALGVDKSFSDSLTTLREMQGQVQKLRDQIADIYDNQQAEIDELRNAIAKLGADTLEQQRKNAGFIEKLLDPTKVDPANTDLASNLAKFWGEALRDLSATTGIAEGFFQDMDKARKAQQDAIEKGVQEAIRATREAEKEATAKAVRDAEQATKALAEKNAQTYRDLWSKIADKDLERIAERAQKETAAIEAETRQRMDNERKFHEERMRILEEYKRGLIGANGALAGLRRLSELPKILKDLKGAI